jgi:hypothetical protein
MLYAAPGTPEDDEAFIARKYRRQLIDLGLILIILIPLGVAYYADTKWVLAVGIGVILIVLNEIDARLYDLCIRVRRINIIAAENHTIGGSNSANLI